jgi:signal transduction histidine kinase
LEQGLSRCRENPEAQEVFSQLLEQTDRQGAILESLLLLSRADAGKLEISAEKINLSELLETWLEDASLLAESRNITIRSEITPDVEIKGDAVLLQQVAHNLFSNAVRYNEDGGTIECRLVRTKSEVEWRIANTGILIPQEDRERVFERFQRASTGVSNSVMGVGLGLSLVKEILVAHGGTVSADVTNDQWMEFTVTMPWA